VRATHLKAASEIDQWRTCVYVACFASGLGPIFWPIISEIYPLAVRGAAMSAATVRQLGMNLVVAVTFLTLVKVLGHSSNVFCCKVSSPSAPGSSSISWSRKPRVRLLNRLKSTGERESRNRHRMAVHLSMQGNHGPSILTCRWEKMQT